MTDLTLSCAFTTSPTSHRDAEVAESLGYERAYFFDSPAIHVDAWVEACRAADRTSRIGLGVAAVVPSNRHPMTNAAAIAHLAAVAGEERVTVAFGSGFTARVAMGQRPLRWAYVRDYVEVVQGLLRGETVEWEGAKVRMMHPPGWAPERPIGVKYLIAASGPKGEAAARELADGVISFPTPVAGFDWSAVQLWGTVLREGEEAGSERAMAAAGHAGAVMLHAAREYGQLAALIGEDRAAEYERALEELPDDERHLELHYGHLVQVNPRDRPFVTPELLQMLQLAVPASGWRERLDGLAAGGATEVVYQPAGDDLAAELEAFAAAARG